MSREFKIHIDFSLIKWKQFIQQKSNFVSQKTVLSVKSLFFLQRN